MRTVLEDMVDLLFLTVALGGARNGRRGECIGDNGQVEEVLAVWV